MSASLFLRELKRLGSLALAALILPAFVYALLLFVEQTELQRDVPEPEEARGLVLALAALIAPWILGAATFAPERESGAASFLARLPLPTWKLLAIRSAAVLVCLAGVHAPLWALAWSWNLPERALTFVIGSTALSLPLLVGAVYASLSLKRSLSAFAAAPLLVWTLAYAAVLPWALFGVQRLPEGELYAVFGFLSLALVAGLVWAARAQRPLSGLHPVRFTWAPLLALCLLNVGTAGAFTLVDRTQVYLSFSGRERGGTEVWGTTLYHQRGHRRLESKSYVILARGDQVAWLPEGHHLLGLSEHAAFTQGSEARGRTWALDEMVWSEPDSPRITPLSASRLSAIQLHGGYVGSGRLGEVYSDLIWARGLLCQAKRDHVLDGRGRRWDLPSGWVVRGATRQSLLAKTPHGQFRLLSLSEPQALERISNPSGWIPLESMFQGWESLEDVVPSESGQTLLAYGRDAEGPAVAGVDLRQERPRPDVFYRPASDLTYLEAAPPLTHFGVGIRYGEDHQPSWKTKAWNPTPLPKPLEGLALPLGPKTGYFLGGPAGELRFGNGLDSVRVDWP